MNEKYSAAKVHLLNIFNLHAHLEFQACHIAQRDSELELLKVHQFQHKVSGKLFYFPPVTDIEVVTPPHQKAISLNEALITYRSLFQQKIIQQSDMTIMPICLAQDREHFNTILICGENVYIIEPRSDNTTSPMFSNGFSFFKTPISNYPIKENVINPLRAMLVTETHTPMISNIFIGIQSSLDTATCGLHQVNFTEAILSLSLEDLKNTGIFIEKFKQCTVEQRKGDAWIKLSMCMLHDFREQLLHSASPSNKTLSPNYLAGHLENEAQMKLHRFVHFIKQLLEKRDKIPNLQSRITNLLIAIYQEDKNDRDITNTIIIPAINNIPNRHKLNLHTLSQFVYEQTQTHKAANSNGPDPTPTTATMAAIALPAPSSSPTSSSPQ